MVEDKSGKIPEYGTRWVKDGWKTVTDYSKKIYEYGTRMVQQGWKTVKDYSRKIIEYGTRTVQQGWKTVKDYGRKIYEYGTRWVTKGLKKVSSWVKGIWGWFKKSAWVPNKVKEKFVKGWHYATKKVPMMVKETFVKGWHYATKTVPNMVKETFVKGWHYATKTVPNLVKETFVKGWHYATKTVPTYAWQQVQVGWKEIKEEVQESSEILREKVSNLNEGSNSELTDSVVLEDVPTAFQDPLGFLQSNLINLGRQNEIAKHLIVSNLGWRADALRSMADHNKNPILAQWREEQIASLKESWNGWKTAAEGVMEFTDYSAQAVNDGRWYDVGRSALSWDQALRESQLAVEKSTAQGVLSVGLNFLLTPIRLATESIPNFVTSVKERLEGKHTVQPSF